MSIAEELKRAAQPGGWHLANQELLTKAADEIERLSAECAHLQTSYDNCNQRICQLLTEKLATAPT